jgi:hypothetical protein
LKLELELEFRAMMCIGETGRGKGVDVADGTNG